MNNRKGRDYFVTKIIDVRRRDNFLTPRHELLSIYHWKLTVLAYRRVRQDVFVRNFLTHYVRKYVPYTVLLLLLPVHVHAGIPDMIRKRKNSCIQAPG